MEIGDDSILDFVLLFSACVSVPAARGDCAAENMNCQSDVPFQEDAKKLIQPLVAVLLLLGLNSC